MGTLKIRYRIFKKEDEIFIFKSSITIKNKIPFSMFVTHSILKNIGVL